MSASLKATPKACLLSAAVLGLASGSAAMAQTTTDAASRAAKDDTTTVVIQGKKQDVVKKVDRTVYDETANPQAQSGSAADVLKTVPAVTVSPDGNVSLRGDGNVQVYINGKPSAMMQGDSRGATLQSMAGSDIASVEVITNPSAAYNANGGGIINIVLKKNRKPGVHGLLKANLSDHGVFNGNLSGSYGHDKLSLSATIGMRHDGGLRLTGSDLDWTDPASGASGRSVQSSRVFARRASRSASFGLDYVLSDSDSLSLSGSYAARHSANRLNEYHQNYDTGGDLVEDYRRSSKGPGGQTDSTLTAIFDHHGDIGDEVKLQAQHSQTVNAYDKSYSNIFAYPVQPDTMDRLLTDWSRRLDEVSGDYVRPLRDTAQVTAGFDVQKIATLYGNFKWNIDPLTGLETADQTTSHRFGVDQTLAAAYVTWQKSAGTWTTLAGLRLETVGTRVDRGVQRSYGNLNPSLHVSYTLDAKRQLKASMSASLQRPDARDLNPFITYVDAQNVTAGNPDLKPQRVSSIEAGYDFTGDRLTYTVTLYYRTSARTVTDYSYFVSDNVLLTTKRNSGNGRSGGIDVSASGKIGRHLSYDTDLNLFYAELQAADLNGRLKQSGLSWTTQLSLEYEPSDTDNFSLDSHFAGRSLTSQGERSGTEEIDLTWRHQLTPRLDLLVRANDIFDGSRQTFTRDTVTVHQTGYATARGQRVFIGLSWRLGG